ncbi:CAP domain-containing protein [Devosia algicola]|uniref:CAP domain-containing protein n=1 Tax=Devosia algicola TaxID=3026418 RepID=A0ABY7YMA7_9HYPH|nr:CAP domain-containing protein [Devosia algicola]WDR02411.1 CAP domain-containing protein [Devosia algicola]
MLVLSRRAFIVLASAGTLSACAGVIPKTIPAGDNRPESLTRKQILAAINAVRKANGRPAWSYNPQLEAAARAQANLMAAKDKLSHDLGVTLRQRVTNAGYYGAVGENLAGGKKISNRPSMAGWARTGIAQPCSVRNLLNLVWLLPVSTMAQKAATASTGQ